ncbi:MAG TPA: hypothetical protein VFI73_09990 [Candidatus Nitrosopolaris sp.]|nr:hypothetical protein [Candidatus Nitrosopolaris sp.]
MTSISTRVMTLSIESILIILVILVIGNTAPNATIQAHLSGPTLQQWVDKETGIKIQFAYKPEKPIADSPTDLSFSVQNLTTGQHIKNFRARVVIINDFQSVFKFLNIPVINGDFSLKYSFPDSGHNQILVSINKDSFGVALASFRVSVAAPFPSPDILAKSIIVGVVMPAAIMTAILVLIKKRSGQVFIK